MHVVSGHGAVSGRNEEATMFATIKSALAVVLVAASATTVLADGYRQDRARHIPPELRMLMYKYSDSSFDPPRMVERKPGWWMSTYECVTDEGYGRFRPCSAN